MQENQLPPNFVSPKARRDIDEMEKENDLRVSRHTGFKPGESISTFYNPDGTAKSTTLPIYTGTPAAETFGAAGTPGASGQLSDGLHEHPMPADPVPSHVALPDPHPGYVMKSLGIAKGDILVATGASTFVRLVAPGAVGFHLVTDPTTATGLRWEAIPAAAANGILAGADNVIDGANEVVVS